MSPGEARRVLRHMIRESGLGLPGFARLVMSRNPRTVERWLAGESPISPVVCAWLEIVTVRRGLHRLCVFVRLPK